MDPEFDRQINTINRNKNIYSAPESDILFLKNLLIHYGWFNEIPKGLDSTFYVTNTYEGDLELQKRIQEIFKLVK